MNTPTPMMSMFINTIQDEEPHDTCVQLCFAGAKRGISAASDTGAGICVLPTRVYRIVFPHVTIQPTHKLSAYNNTTINVVEKIDVSCKYNNICKPLNFIVTDEHTKTIIEKRDAINLKCIQFLDRTCNPNIDYVKYINTTTHPMIVAKKKRNNVLPISKIRDAKKEIQSLFPVLFQDIGCVKTTYKIELNQCAVHDRHSPRRVPEAMKPTVKIEIARLVSEGIHRSIECPTDWVSSIVTVTKANGSIRLCLDPRDLNKYICRPHYYSPTIDDMLPDIPWSKFFSTLDARSG